MAQKLNSVTPDIKPPDVANPDGSFLDKNNFNVGSPTLAGLANSTYSFFSAMMRFAGIDYSGQVDTTTVSQYFQALSAIINTKITAITDPLTIRVGQNEDNIDTNESGISTNASNIGILGGRITSNDTDINNLQLKTPQSYKTTDIVRFKDLILDGVTSVKDSIISLLSRMTNTENATGVNAGNISTNAGNISDNSDNIGVNAGAIGTNAGNISDNADDISTNAGKITDLEEKTPQSYKTTDTIILVDLFLTGLGNIKGTIQGLVDVSTPEDAFFDRINLAANTALPDLLPKQRGSVTVSNSTGSTYSVSLPSGGTFAYSYFFWNDSSGEPDANSNNSVSGGAGLLSMDFKDRLTIDYRRIS